VFDVRLKETNIKGLQSVARLALAPTLLCIAPACSRRVQFVARAAAASGQRAVFGHVPLDQAGACVSVARRSCSLSATVLIVDTFVAGLLSQAEQGAKQKELKEERDILERLKSSNTEGESVCSVGVRSICPSISVCRDYCRG
jgi:hypothetical protein